MENSTTEAPTPTLRKTTSLPAYDLALRREDDANSSSDTNSARVASIAEEEDVVSLSSASELSLRGLNGDAAASASAPSAATPLDAALSPSPSSTTSSAVDVTTERQSSNELDKDTLAQLPKASSKARSVPTLERSHTSGELIGLRTRERQAAESAYSSPSSGSAPSFEIESVTLPTDGVTEADFDKATHTVFSVEVKLQGGLQWLIRKRYSDFRELHDRLKRTNSSVKQLYFPKRHVFRNRHQSVVEQRRSELEKYINEVLDIRPLIRVPLFNFLEVYAHMESYERKLQRHKKELESERMKNMLPPELVDDFSAAFKRLCLSKYLYHGNTSAGHKTEAETSRSSTSSTTAASSGPPSGRPPTSPVKDIKATTTANAGEASKGSTTDERGNRHSVIMHTAGSQICISRASFRRDILGVFPDMPSSFAMRFMKAVSDRQGSDINMDEFLRAVAILRCGTMEDQLQFIFNMCDLDHAGKVQSTGLSNFLVSLHGRHVLDRAEYRRLLSEGFDQGRVRMSCDEFIKIVPELKAYHTLVDWMAPFADILCETADPQLLESQEEFNPAVQQKILANESHFNAKEVSVLQDAFNNYRASSGGDAVDMDALTSDFPLEMSEERFARVFSSFGSRANGSDIDVFSFVSALSISCRGTTKEKSEFAFKLFASVGDGSYMTREDVYGMLRLDITQNPDLESQITALIEKKYPSLNATKSASSSSLIENMGPRTPSVSGSELGIFVDGIMKGFGHRRSVWDASSSSKHTEALTLTLEEFTTWAIKQKFEMATLRIMREVAFIDLGLVPATKEEELLIATGCYTPYDPATLVEDDRWYLIERKWYIHWCRYIKIHVKESLLLSPPVAATPTTATSTPSTSKVQMNGGSTANKENYMKNLKGEIVRPKCINNYPLLTSDRRDRILKTSEEIKLGRHYVIICEQLWMALKLWYGGGPEIQRQVVVAVDGEPMLDIWEAETKKMLLKKKSKGKENDTDGEGEDDDDMEDDSSSVPSEEETRRKQELALPRRMRSGGSVGLANLGNTCYMNSALQCLTNTKLLAEYFLSGMYLEDINRTSTLGLQGKLAEVYGKLAEDMWCVKQKSISPRNFKKSIGKFNEVFRGNDQQDAQELLAFLLSGLSEDLNRIQDKPYIEQPDSDGRYDADLADEWWRNHLRREVSIIVALFTGQYKSLLTCSICGFKSARFEPFTFLQVPLPEPKHNTVTVQMMLANGVTPMKVSVRLSISATIFDLKHELMKMCHEEFDLPDVTESDIKLCEFSGSMILSFKADNRRVGQIRSIDRLIAFQLEPLDSETVQATRHRRPSYVQAVGVGGLRAEEADHSSFYEKLSKGTLVDVRMRTQSHEYIPAVVLEPPSAHADYEDQPVVLVRLRRSEDEIKVPLNRLRPRQARLLYIPLLSRKLSYSAVYFKNPFRPVPFGSPNLVRLCPELTSGLHLYQLVWERVKQYVGSNATPPTEWVEEDAHNADHLVANHIDGVFAGLNDVAASFSSKCGFLLRRVENKGLTDSRSSWLTRSFGFTIPCTSEPLDILEEEAIAIDWDLSVFQDREMMDKMKHVESHDSVARNEAIDKGPVPLSHCLDAFTSEEKISEGYCSSCRQHQEMTKKLEIWRLPPVMVVHLKRFQYTQTYRRKLGSLVEFPIHDLDLSSTVAPHIEIPDKYPMKKPKGASSVSAPARKLIKLRSRGESNGSIATAPASRVLATGSAANEVAAESAKQADEGSEDDIQGEKPEDSELASDTAVVGSIEGEGESSSSPNTKATSSETEDTTDSQRAAAAQAAAVRNRVRRGYTNSNLDQSRCLETKYNLYGVVNHQGALGGGHYTAYAKNFVDDQWYYYDDERVRVVEEQQVVSPSAYLLFYLRSDMDSVLVKDLFPKNMKPGKITDEDIERFVEEGDERRCSIM